MLFARTEGIVPAPEPTHALAAAVEEALRCKETGEEKVILTALCGHGHLDLPAYDAYLSGSVVDHEWEDADIQAAGGRRAVPAAGACLTDPARPRAGDRHGAAGRGVTRLGAAEGGFGWVWVLPFGPQPQ